MREKLFVENITDWNSLFSRDIHISREPNVLIVNNGIILPAKPANNAAYYKGGVCTENFEFITGLCRASSDYSKAVKVWGEVLDSYTVDKAELIYVDETVVFGGVFIGQFGHMMIENLNRLWWHIQNLSANYKFVFITSAGNQGGGYKSYFGEFLALLDIPPERIVFLEKPTQFREIIVPEEAEHMGNEYMSEWLLPHKYIMESVMKRISNISELPKKVYFTKRYYNIGGEQLCNEVFFEKFYEQRGYSVIVPEALPVYKQIALVANADEFATTIGSTSVFVLFAKPTAKVTLLTRTNIPHRTQCFVDQAVKADISLVDVSCNYLTVHPIHGVHFIGPTQSWIKFVREVCKENSYIGNFTSDMHWDYIVSWLKFYVNNPSLFSVHKLGKITLNTLMANMCHYLLGKDINFDV